MKIDCLDIAALPHSLTYTLKDESFFNDFKYILNSNEYQWLIYYFHGYKQYEIAKKMNVSDTTIKKYKSSARIKLQQYYLEGDWHVTS
ncbi:putative DNA-binding protein [Staphylococcus hominis]|nr:putative DNA-binding protein [Staphylococcus hominis]